MEPTVSVLMTAYNREAFIGQSIESVLASDFGDFELIVVDDCSKDGTLEIAKRFEKLDKRVKVYVNSQNLGDYPNRNMAASYATGKYLKYVDADDTLYDYCLSVMVRYTDRFPEAGFGLSCFADDDRPFPYLLSPREIYFESFTKTNHFDRAPGSGLVKKKVFDAVGGFSGKRMVGDYEFWLKISRYYSMVKLPLDIYWNRIHPGQESQSEYARRNYAKLRKEILEDALTHPDCPLTPDDMELIRNRLKKLQRKEKVLQYLSKASKVIKF